MISSGAMVSLIAVEPRRSENHSTALDALGDAARDAPAHHLLGGVAPEIDPAERARDIHLRGGLDREPQHRHQVAQRREFLLRRTLRAAGRPVGIQAVHLADGAGLAEPVHEGRGNACGLCSARSSIMAKSSEAQCDRSIRSLVPAIFEHVIDGSNAASSARRRPRRSIRIRRFRSRRSRYRSSESRGPRRSGAACR